MPARRMRDGDKSRGPCSRKASVEVRFSPAGIAPVRARLAARGKSRIGAKYGRKMGTATNSLPVMTQETKCLA